MDLKIQPIWDFDGFPRWNYFNKAMLFLFIGPFFRRFHYFEDDSPLTPWKWKKLYISQAFAPQFIMWHHDDMPWRRHMVTSHHMPWWFYMEIPFVQKPGNHIFWPRELDLWPMTLTTEFVLEDVIKVNPHTSFQVRKLNSLAMSALTYRKTLKDSFDSITWTAGVGGNNCWLFRF